MTVSLLLILFFLLIRIPSYLLPRNRLKVYLYSALVACFVIGLIGLIDRIGSASVEDKLGRFFSPMFSFLIDPIKGITVKEAHHVYCYLANSLLYVVSFLLALPVFSFFLVGNNPSIYLHVRWLSRFFLSFFFILSTYGILFLIIVNLRRILPLPSGFLEPVFSRFYPLGA